MPATSIQLALNGLKTLLFPKLCENCRQLLAATEEVVCTSCELQIPETDFHTVADNAAARLFYGRVPLLNVTSYAYFTDGGIMQELLHGLKYNDRRSTGLWLGRRLGAQMAGAGWAAKIHCIVPVPLHPTKEASRGYNQSELIARGIADAIQKPVRTDVLIRQRRTESQTRKSRAERTANLDNAFTVAPGADIASKHILLCDDVLTTGATLEACALTLQQVANVKISIATIAIAVA